MTAPEEAATISHAVVTVEGSTHQDTTIDLFGYATSIEARLSDQEALRAKRVLHFRTKVDESGKVILPHWSGECALVANLGALTSKPYEGLWAPEISLSLVDSFHLKGKVNNPRDLSIGEDIHVVAHAVAKGNWQYLGDMVKSCGRDLSRITRRPWSRP